MISEKTKPLVGWGRYPRIHCAVEEPADAEDMIRSLGRHASLVARGNGRSYGDSSLNRDGVAMTSRLRHMLAFDEETGELTCEAGVMLSDIIALFLPRGWFPPVTPGTRFVTVGGMIAADVHGKNHHGAGSFGDHLLWLDLALPNGQVLRCSAARHPELFDATRGGMGLTGIILRAALRLIRIETAFIRQRTVRAPTLDHAFAVFEELRDATYSVGWIDGLANGGKLGRSVIFLGEHAKAGELGHRAGDPLRCAVPNPKRVPVDFPAIALSRLPVRLFNALYYGTQRQGEATTDIYHYFYPLDALLEWNRIYGRRGFVQYQCVLPLAESRAGIERLLAEIARRGDASFLAVLKRLGPASSGYLSFPMEGYTLAMDFPVNDRNLMLLDRLDEITIEHHGRLYLAKDARMSPRMIAVGYPRLKDFTEVRRRYGLVGRIESAQSQRLEL